MSTLSFAGVCGVDVCDCGGVCFLPEKRDLKSLLNTDVLCFEVDVDVGLCCVSILIVSSVAPVSLPSAAAVFLSP